MSADSATAEADHRTGDAPVRILQIAGSGRCGSTLLDRMLGQHGDVFAAGEILLLWDRGLATGGRCGCGRRTVDCDVWSAVLVDVYGSLGAAAEAARSNGRHQHALTTSHLIDLVGSRRRSAHAGRLEELTDQVEAVYRSIVRLTGARVVVDASKNVVYGALMAGRPGVDAMTLQLVRDPRATAFSWSRPKPNPGDGLGRPMWSAGAARSSAFWAAQNLALVLLAREAPDRFLRLRYEDFVADPMRSLDDIGRFVGIELTSAFPDGCEGPMDLGPTHSAWGNPNRFAGSSVELVADDRWRTRMPRRDLWVASLIAAPTSACVGYPVLPTRRGVDGPR